MSKTSNGSLVGTNTLYYINTERDIEKLRSICYILAKEYPETFSLVLDKAKEYTKNKIIYDKIDKLEKELKNLRRKII